MTSRLPLVFLSGMPLNTPLAMMMRPMIVNVSPIVSILIARMYMSIFCIPSGCFASIVLMRVNFVATVNALNHPYQGNLSVFGIGWFGFF